MCCPGILIFVHIWNEKKPHDSAKLRCFPNKCSWNKFLHHKLIWENSAPGTLKCWCRLACSGGRQRHGAGRAGRRPSPPQHSPWAVPLGFRGCWNANRDVQGSLPSADEFLTFGGWFIVDTAAGQINPVGCRSSAPQCGLCSALIHKHLIVRYQKIYLEALYVIDFSLGKVT